MGLLSDISQDTSVYIEDVTVYRIRGFRCQEHCRTGKFFRSQPAACRSLGADERVERVTATGAARGRWFLNYAQKNGAVVSLSEELPQCYVLADAPVDTVYLSELSSAAMKRRAEQTIQ